MSFKPPAAAAGTPVFVNLELISSFYVHPPPCTINHQQNEE